MSKLKFQDNPSGKTPILFIHGTGHTSWHYQVNFTKYFADLGYPYALLDIKGTSKDEKVVKSFKEYIDDVVEAIKETQNHFNINPIVVSHSLSTMIMQDVIDDKLSEVKGVVFLSPSTRKGKAKLKPYPDHEAMPLTKNIAITIQAIISKSLSGSYNTPKKFKYMFLEEDADEKQVNEYWEHTSNNAPLLKEMVSFASTLPKPYDSMPPLLFLSGSKDKLTAPEAAEETAKLYGAKAKYMYFPGIPHDMMLSNKWEEVAKAINDWIVSKSL